LSRGPDIVPIPGTRRASRLDENAAAASIHLGAHELQRLDGLLAERPVAGTRYPAAGMASVNA
jgi:aryl-alcohol dehydrogenase-like predicted oxidoreductase